MHNWLWLVPAFGLSWLGCPWVGRADTSAGTRATAVFPVAGAPAASVGVNYNDGSPLQPEFPEHIYRNAGPGNWPVPAISGSDLASGLKPVIITGQLHALSGTTQKLTDGVGASTDDDPSGSCFFDNGVRAARFLISLPQAASIGQINLYAWHRDPLAGGSRAPLKVHVYASGGATPGFNPDNPGSPGYVLLARVNTVRRGGVNIQAGQHGASITATHGESLGHFRHFLFEVVPGLDGVSHTFLNEVDIVRAATRPASAQAAPANHFDTHIAPLLARRCLGCHNPTDKKGGLDLTGVESARQGGESGAAVTPGKPDDSLLLQRVLDNEMPPKRPLADDEKDLLRKWIASGAAWGNRPINRFQFSSETRAGYDWWSLRPLSQPSLPQVTRKDWTEGAIDRFVLARLETKGVSPAPAATRHTLIRRLSFDLIGLPPTPEDVAAFVRDAAPGAYERLVDRLLASPQYGERWARHWLDIVRFAESQGFERNKFYPSAWKYRDWVIQAFNDDMPYDEFVRLQLAGDVLHANDPQALVASEYLVFSPHDLLGLTQGSEAMKAATREDELENLVGNVGQTFLGLTINCARCHDHKFDPLRQSEYFQLAAALGGLERTDRVLGSAPLAAVTGDLLQGAAVQRIQQQLARALGERGQETIDRARAEDLDAAKQALSRAKTALAEAEQKLAAAQSQVGRAGAPADISVVVANAKQVVADRQRELRSADDEYRFACTPSGTRYCDRLLEQVPREQRAICAPLISKLSCLEMRARLQFPGTTYGFASTPPQYFHVLDRGNFRNPGPVVAAGGFQCIADIASDWRLSPAAPETVRRVQLARWITDPRNPLPARVIANRLWHYHFGVGLVDTPNDFGFSGGRPSHPELLDYLGSELMRHGWSLKHLQRQIVLSATYRQAAQFNPRAAQFDSGNRLLWRKTPLRLEAETFRDAVLAVSGELNPRMGGPSFRDLEIGVEGDNAAYKPLDAFSPATNRRSVYRMVARAATPPLLETLDCADPTVATPRRSVTTTPLQALSLMNNPFMLRSAEAFAARVEREAGHETDNQIDRAYQLALGRAVTDQEQQRALQFTAKYGLADLCLMIFNSNEFLHVD